MFKTIQADQWYKMEHWLMPSPGTIVVLVPVIPVCTFESETISIGSSRMGERPLLQKYMSVEL